MLPSIWIVGPTQVGKYHLVKAILPEVNSKTDAYTWTIDTKYYVADVAISTQGTDATSGSGAPEALVLVIDATDSSTFQQAKAWVQKHGMDDVEIKLLVANKADLIFSETSNDVQRPAWLESAIDWSIAECFEYIETSALHLDIDKQLCLDGEQAGTARLISALQAHMWPGMKRKDGTSSVDSLPPATASAPPQSDAAIKDQTRKGTQEPSATDASDSGPNVEAAIDQDDELEKKIDRFDELLAEIQGARDRFAHLPDDKRRAAAAELAMRLASMLDEDEDEDDE